MNGNIHNVLLVFIYSKSGQNVSKLHKNLKFIDYESFRMIPNYSYKQCINKCLTQKFTRVKFYYFSDVKKINFNFHFHFILYS